ncbi:unnamed protein product, partial [Ixodes hexagonus]
CGIRGPRSGEAGNAGGADTDGAASGAKRRGVHRIVGGKDADPVEFSWQISLRRKLPLINTDRGHTCGGSIISEQYVVTAAHCVDGLFTFPSNYKVMVGDQNINQKDETEGDFEIEKITKHPDWDRDTLNYDYAVLRLKTPLDFNGQQKHLMPICLPEKDQSFEGQNCTASGWGLTKNRLEGGKSLSAQLQKADLPILAHNVCKEYYEQFNEVHDNTMICAGPPEGGKGVCQANSGGPLQCARPDGRYVLAGATSWGVVCAAEKRPGVFAKISPQVDWIKQVAGMTT